MFAIKEKKKTYIYKEWWRRRGIKKSQKKMGPAGEIRDGVEPTANKANDERWKMAAFASDRLCDYVHIAAILYMSKNYRRPSLRTNYSQASLANTLTGVS